VHMHAQKHVFVHMLVCVCSDVRACTCSIIFEVAIILMNLCLWIFTVNSITGNNIMVSLPNAVTTDFLTDGMSMPKGFMNDEEKTFQYQNQLPSLPIPNLSVTLAKYLDSGRYQYIAIVVLNMM